MDPSILGIRIFMLALSTCVACVEYFWVIDLEN